MRTIYRIDRNTEVTPGLLYNYVEYVKPELARRERLFNYYTGKHGICNRVYSDDSKPNNKVVNPYPHYITDFTTGYFVGEPVRYEAEDNVQALIDSVTRYNDDQSVNTELAKDISICGYGYELEFVDKYGEYRYIPLDPCKCFCIYDNTLENEVLYAVRLYDEYDVANRTMLHYVILYTPFETKTYKQVSAMYELVKVEPNNLGDMPVIEYVNNAEAIGDYELCLTLIDAYDSVVSDSVNDSAEFADAYLVLTGMSGTTGDDVAEMKTNRVLLLDTDASAQWLTKTGDTQGSENLKSRLNNEIHKFSAVPDMSDVNFASNASGVAMKYKLLGLEDVTAKKETEFKRGLARRFEIFSEYVGLVGESFDWRMINIIFTRNLPSNLEETADMLGKIGHLLSTETQLAMLPLDVDVKKELERKASESTALTSADTSTITG